MVTESERKQFSKYQAEWEANARFDAKWAVLSLADKIGDGWDERSFYQIGVEEIAATFAFLERHGIAPPARGACLDFGCGVGRITEALGAWFDEVVGIDISPSMLAQANAYAKKRPNTSYVLSDSPDLESVLGGWRFDMVYTNITLQHLSNDLQKQYIRQFAKVLKPGGLAVFQIPSQAPKRMPLLVKLRKIVAGAGSGWRSLFSVIANSFRLLATLWKVRIELNVLPEGEVVRTGNAAGLELLTKAYIDWDELYRSHGYALRESPAGLSEHFPVSTVYCFRAGPVS